jgi:hypothetical protein
MLKNSMEFIDSGFSRFCDMMEIEFLFTGPF